MMLLRAGAVVVLLLLAGCAAPDAPTLAESAAATDEPQVTAVRVEPLAHWLDESGRIAVRPCAPDADGASCRGAVVRMGDVALGADWPEPVYDAADAQALFWRVALRLDWAGDASWPGLRVTVLATAPCGVECVREREVAFVGGSGSPMALEPLDVFLEPGETGIRLRIAPDAAPNSSSGEAEYRLQGYAAGFRAAGEPFLLQ